MYIVGFIKSLFTPRKFPSVLYFLANQAVVFGVFWLIGSAVNAQNPNAWGVWGIVINLIIMLAMLSPFGEAVVRYREGATAVPRAQYSRTCMLFQEICDEARKVNKSLPQDIRLYQIKSTVLNAAATGHHTVIVTTGLMELVERGIVPPQQFKAVIAHELGHISHSDTSLTLGIVVSGGILQLVLCAYIFIVRIIASLLALLSVMIATGFILIFGRSVTFVFDCWNKLGIVLTNATSRKDEFAADHFAGQCGYAAELCDFLLAIDPSRTRSSFLSVLTETHPATVDRVAQLQKDF